MLVRNTAPRLMILTSTDADAGDLVLAPLETTEIPAESILNRGIACHFITGELAPVNVQGALEEIGRLSESTTHGEVFRKWVGTKFGQAVSRAFAGEIVPEPRPVPAATVSGNPTTVSDGEPLTEGN